MFDHGSLSHLQNVRTVGVRFEANKQYLINVPIEERNAVLAVAEVPPSAARSNSFVKARQKTRWGTRCPRKAQPCDSTRLARGRQQGLFDAIHRYSDRRRGWSTAVCTSARRRCCTAAWLWAVTAVPRVRRPAASCAARAANACPRVLTPRLPGLARTAPGTRLGFLVCGTSNAGSGNANSPSARMASVRATPPRAAYRGHVSIGSIQSEFTEAREATSDSAASSATEWAAGLQQAGPDTGAPCSVAIPSSRIGAPCERVRRLALWRVQEFRLELGQPS